MAKLMWFLKYRWSLITMFKHGGGGNRYFPQAAFKNNLCGCAQHGAIMRDIIKINRRYFNDYR